VVRVEGDDIEGAGTSVVRVEGDDIEGAGTSVVRVGVMILRELIPRW
jgi:hypothetical protein